MKTDGRNCYTDMADMVQRILLSYKQDRGNREWQRCFWLNALAFVLHIFLFIMKSYNVQIKNS